MGWDEIRWDGMRRDGMGWGGCDPGSTNGGKRGVRVRGPGGGGYRMWARTAPIEQDPCFSYARDDQRRLFSSRAESSR